MAGLIIAFFFQEPLTSAIAIGYALHAGVSPTTVHILYVSLTVFDICAGYMIGNYVVLHYSHTKLFSFLHKYALNFFPQNLRLEKRILFFVVNPGIFPLTPFLLPFLGFTFVEAAILMVLSNVLIWYSAVWGLVLGYISTTDQLYISVLLTLPFVLFFIYRRLRIG